MRLTAQQVHFDVTQKTARLAAPADGHVPQATENAQRAKELLRGMAADLVSNGKVKSGYLRLSQDGDGARLAAGHFGSGATAATDLVKNLVREAYGDVATQALEDYLGRSKGGKVGTQSFVKLVQSLEAGHLSPDVQSAEIKSGAKLRTLNRQGQDLGTLYRFDSDLVQGLQGRLEGFGSRVKTLSDQINDPSQEPGQFLASGRSLATELQDGIKLLMMRPNALSLPGAKTVEQGLLGLLADLQCDLAHALLDRNHNSAVINGDEVAEARKLLIDAKRHAQAIGNDALVKQAEEGIKDSEALKAELEGVPQAEPMSDEDLNADDWKAMLASRQNSGKTDMAPPDMEGGEGSYMSVSEYLQRQQNPVAREPSVARASAHEAGPLAGAAQVAPKVVVAPENQGVWMHQDLRSRMQSMGWTSAEAAQAALVPRAEAIVDLSYEDNEAALNFLQQSAELVQANVSDRLAEPPRLELDENSIGRSLKNIEDVVEQIYADNKVSAEDYLTVSILLNMQRN